MKKSNPVTKLAFFFLVVTIVATMSSMKENVDTRIKSAVREDFQKMHSLFDLHEGLEEGQPTSQEEIDEWVKRAQEASQEMLSLHLEAQKLRSETITYLNSLDPSTQHPLKQATLEYFEAENKYYLLTMADQGETSVEIHHGDSLTEEQRRKILAIAETGKELEESFRHLLETQQRLISQARDQGLSLSPYLSEAEQQEMLDSYKTMGEFGKALGGK